MKHTTTYGLPEALTGSWEDNRDRQLRVWAATPPERRVAWLEEAVAAAYRSGALPRGAGGENGGRGVAWRAGDIPLPPLAGSPEGQARGEQARREGLERLCEYFRGPCPQEVDRTVFAEYGMLAQFALWSETEASFWCEMAEASVHDLIAAAMRRDTALRRFVEKQDSRRGPFKQWRV